ncbi:oligoendopeptidase F [Bacillus songklensis]|uniref:Oligopeptidase F n=1 Tax=Bacillus songklensis TaxID=1069116 RepID=A0ABV8B4P9_9BACI
MGKYSGLIKTSVVSISLTSLFVFSPLSVQSTETPAFAEQAAGHYTWNLGDIYPSREAFNDDIETVKQTLLPKLQKYEGKLNSSKTILQLFKLSEETARKVEKLYLYAHLMKDLNIEDEHAANLCSTTEQLYADYGSAVSFMEPELLSLPDKKAQSIIKDPLLKDYAHTLRALYKQKEHTLSKKEEALLAQLSPLTGVPESVYDNASVGDIQYETIKKWNGKKVEVSESTYLTELENPNREYRKKVFQSFFTSYDRIKHTTAAALFGSVKTDELLADARNYNSGLDASLSKDYIPESVFNNLLSSVDSKLQYLHEYIDLRKKVMKLDKVHGYDMYAPLVDQAVVHKMKFPVEKAKATILQGLQPLGKDYVKKVEQGFNSRWLDVYPKKKKATGAYNWDTYDTHPFVLLNYDETLNDMLTIAHEMGHAMNSVYTNDNQPYHNAGQSIFTAEVASTANELIMMDYLINKAATDDEKLYLINKQIDAIRGTVYFQTMYSEFEKAIHEKVRNKENLTAQTLNELWAKVLQKYHGPSYQVDELSSVGWSRISHFYSQYYVYKYATSMSAAFELVKQMKEDPSGAATERYLNFLAAGTSDYPIELLKNAGVDMISPEPVDHVLEYFHSLVMEMERILKKQGKI